jgi:hypothetical protein
LLGNGAFCALFFSAFFLLPWSEATGAFFVFSISINKKVKKKETN